MPINIPCACYLVITKLLLATLIVSHAGLSKLRLQALVAVTVGMFLRDVVVSVHDSLYVWCENRQQLNLFTRVNWVVPNASFVY